MALRRGLAPGKAYLLGLVLVGCASGGCDDAPLGRDCQLRLMNFPTCPKGQTYERPMIVTVERAASILGETVVIGAQVNEPPSFSSGPEAAKKGGPPGPVLVVPRERFSASVRVGLCSRTSLATWNCKTPRWLAAVTLQIDGRHGRAELAIPSVAPGDVTCVARR